MEENKIVALVKENVAFLKEVSPIFVKEIGDGNVNYVYRVGNDDQSVILKFADDYIRGSSERKLSAQRNNIEAYILKFQNELLPGISPKIYHHCEKEHYIIMEDLKKYHLMNREMVKGKTYPFFAEVMSQYFVRVLLKTTDLVMDPQEKKILNQKLTNPQMCEISERLVFREPYFNVQKLNSYAAQNHTFVQKELYEDEKLHDEIAYLKDRFKNYAQGMIHGDLHLGSIFIGEKDLKIIDPEFAFYGPIGYDIGNVLAHLLINLFIAKHGPNSNTQYETWVEKTILALMQQFVARYEENYDKLIKEALYLKGAWKQYYIAEILADAWGYAGTEIIRRTVGVAKTFEIKQMADSQRIETERSLIQLGKYCIMNRTHLMLGEALLVQVNPTLRKE